MGIEPVILSSANFPRLIIVERKADDCILLLVKDTEIRIEYPGKSRLR